MNVSLEDICKGISDVLGVPIQNIAISNDLHCTIQGNESTPLTINTSHPLFLYLNSFQKLSFVGCHFKKEEDCIFLHFNIKKIEFKNCVFLDQTIAGNFKGDVDFIETHFYENVYFLKSEIKGNFNLIKNTFHQDVFFSECSFQPPPKETKETDERTTFFSHNKFRGETQIVGCIFYNKTKFENLIFFKDLVISAKNNGIQNLFDGIPIVKDFTWLKFSSNVEFIEIRVKGNLSLSFVAFESNVIFKNFSSDKRIAFFQNTFVQTLFLHDIQCPKIEFISTGFSKNPELKELKEIETLGFTSCVFAQEFSLTYIDLSLLPLDLRQSTFQQGVNFHKKTLLNINFSHVKTENIANFDYTTFVENANFQKANFLESASFYGAKFDNTPNFAQSSFQKEINLINTNLSFDYEDVNAKIQQTFNNNNQDKKPLDFIINDFRDSFRIFKHTLSKEGNLLDASNYHRVELYCKEIELDSKLEESWNWRDWIDKWQLCLYRHTSDHHTDLLKIISWILIAIGCFGVLYLGARAVQDVPIIDKLNPYGLALSFAGSILTLPFCTTIKKPFFKFGRYLTILSSISTLWIACYKPTLIFGAMNLIDRSSRSGLENLLLVLYTLAMILLLFSLQKTARKNSIIPG